MEIVRITHPEYDAMLEDWGKWRLTYESGSAFIEEYLKQFSDRESSTDFSVRKSISYVPAHAKVAINDVKNAIYQRMIDITRSGGPISYQDAITGMHGGVDLKGNSMNGFIGRIALPELLVMAKVGIYVDKPRMKDETPIYVQKNIRPYIYMYKAKQIRSWLYDDNDQLVSLLLEDRKYTIDDEFGLMSGEVHGYRLLNLLDDGVHVRLYDSVGIPDGEEIVLNLTTIPFVLGDISMSLMTDIADYQIGLLNLASGDMNYCQRANFPFYTEQYFPSAEALYLRQADASTSESNAGVSAEAAISRDKEVKIGATKGRRYPKGLERPGFIAPPGEPLQISMAKQEQMKQEIRQLISLNLTNIEPRRASAEAKAIDERGLESGLSFIGLELEYMEREIARIWAEYENRKKPDAATIYYPVKYSLKSEAERRAEAAELIKEAAKIPSNIYQREAMKEAIDLTMGIKVSDITLKEMKTEVDRAEVVIVDPEIIREDVQDGICSRETASKARGYPEGDIAKANKEQAERASIIAISQSKERPAARGVVDLDVEGRASAREEKKDNNAS